jgi:hypothetical protein
MDPRIFAATPNIAIELGFDQYLRDSRGDSAIRDGATRTLEEFEKFVESFPHGSAERMYLTTLRMAAASIASGIARRKKMLAERLKEAEEEQDLFLRGFTRGARLGGFMIGALKLILVGGFMYYLVRGLAPAVVHEPALAAGATDTAARHADSQYMSLATAFGTTLIVSTIKEFWQGFRLQRSRKKYKAEVKKANDWYQDEVSREYRLAAETANIAWLQLTGNPPPMTRAFECLLAGVLTTCTEDGHLTEGSSTKL